MSEITVREINDGQQITEDGVYLVPIDRYHNDPNLFPGHSVSSTGLRRAANSKVSMLEYWYKSTLNPNRAQDEGSEALRFGKGVHSYLLEGKLPEDEFAYHEFENWSSNEGHEGAFKDESGGRHKSFLAYKRAWKAEQEAAGKTLVSQKDIEVFDRMASVLADDPMVKVGLMEGLVEHTIAFKDPETGIWVKIRPDIIPTGNMLGDYKAVADASPEATSRSLGDYAYHQQLGLGVEGIARVLGREIETSFLLCQEKKDPHPYNIAPLTDNAIWWGIRQNRMGLQRIKWCLDNNKWPGYARWDKDLKSYVEGPQSVDLPPYYENSLKYRDELEGIPDVNIKDMLKNE